MIVLVRLTRECAMKKLCVTMVLMCALSFGCSKKHDSTTSTTTGGGDAASGAALSGKVNEHGTKTPSGDKIEVELDDFYFAPTHIKAEVGSKLTIELKNEGKAKHNFTMEAAKVNVDLEPGASKTVTLTVPKASDAGFYCEYHRKGGMQGSIVEG